MENCGSDEPIGQRVDTDEQAKAGLLRLLEDTEDHRFAKMRMAANAFQSTDWLVEDTSEDV